MAPVICQLRAVAILGEHAMPGRSADVPTIFAESAIVILLPAG
jgi:hypothetical protein